jgi:L,D-transpeptidase ErfK/SrfK
LAKRELFMKSILILPALLIPVYAGAITLELPADGSDLVGKVQVIQLDAPMTLREVGRSYDLGPREMEAANPKLSKVKALDVGENVTLPLEFILPKVREGIVVNYAELRLYFFPPGTKTVETFPIAIARLGGPTPVGVAKVEWKQKDPWWYPPPSIRAENPRLPMAVPPGPHNPLGKFAINPAFAGILIHGTDNPESVGTRASHGCIRMLPKDIESFWDRVPDGARIAFIDEPVAFGLEGGRVYVRLVPPVKDWMFDAHFNAAVADLETRTNGTFHFLVDPQTVKGLPKDGIPAVVGSVTPTL